MRNLTLFSVLLLLSLLQNLKAQNYPLGATSMAMGYSTVATTDLWAVHHNQAALGFLEGINAGLFYQTSFLVNQISTKALVFNYALNNSSIGLEASSFGFSKYSENKVGLSYGLKLFKNFAMGVQVDYFNIHQTADYGDFHMITAEIGIVSKPTENLTVAAHVFNPWATKVGTTQLRLSTIARVGLAYYFNDDVLFLAELEKELDLPLSWKTGLQYEVSDNLYLRGGALYAQKIWRPTFGVGYKISKIQIDLAFENRPLIGMMSGVSLQYRFK